MTIKYYSKQYAGILPKIFIAKSHFLRTFGGKLQVKDGVMSKERFMDLKITDTEVIIQDYSVDANTAFGTGTGSSNRFGPRKEIKSVDAQINYDAPLSIHEGIDDVTVDDMPDEVVAERLALHAEAWAEHLNTVFATILSTSASATITKELTEAGVTAAFNQASETFINNKVSRTVSWVAYVRPSVNSFLVDNNLTTLSKQAPSDVSTNTIAMFKNFIIEPVPDVYFAADEHILFTADNTGVAGIGIEITRTMDSEDFAGVALQGAAKYAKYIPEKNKAAILKAKLTIVV